MTAFIDTSEALAALKQGRCSALLYDDVWIEGELQKPEWTSHEMPLPSREVQPWGLAVRKGQPDWAAYLSTLVKKWTKDGTIVDLETKFHIKHSKFAEEEHLKASASSDN